MELGAKSVASSVQVPILRGIMLYSWPGSLRRPQRKEGEGVELPYVDLTDGNPAFKNNMVAYTASDPE